MISAVARMGRRVSAAAALAVFAGLGGAASALADTPADFPLTFAGYAIQPAAVPGEAEAFGGISGLDYDRATGLFRAITDARNAGSDGPPRTYTFRIAAGGDSGFRLEDIRSQALQAPGGGAFARNAVTAEAVRLAPGGGFYWGSEGECGASEPTLWRTGADGAVAPVPIRAEYHYAANCPRQTAPGLTGARNNGALESLALSPDSRTLFYANEYPLLQDDLAAAGTEAHPVRITAAPADGGSGPVRQYAYFLPKPFGVTEMATLGEGRFLVLERQYFPKEKASTARLALATLGDATDIAGLGEAAIEPGAVKPAARQELLVLNGGRTLNPLANLFGAGAPMDNLEAMALGCIGGAPVLVLAADDNFGKFGPQANLFLVFSAPASAISCER